MSSFGLGLVLSFVDNASAGMRGATQTFQQMSSTADAVSGSVGNSMANMVAASYALDSVGTTLVNIGSSVVGTFFNISQEVIDTGMTMMGFRMQLRALYGESGFEDKMKQIQEYARDSVFEVEGLMQAVVTMKAVGIEAMEAVTSSSGNTTQTLMDYASDIAAMFPNMRNAYGTGVNAAMGAMKEYIAEGNALSLKRGAGLDILGILGEEKGETIEERTRQVADLVEILGIAGYTTSLLGTPTQQLSKIQDVLFNAMSDIADSGVFEKYTALLTKAATWVTNLSMDTEKYSAIVSIIGETITSVLTPVESILDSLIAKADALLDWAVANPNLAKNILLTVAAVGAFLVAGGLFLKFTSALGMASAGFNFLKTLPSLLSTVASGFGNLVWKALPFIALAGLAYYAWTHNLFGIRDAISGAVRDIVDVFTVLSDAWGDFELSAENYDLAESLGILPLVESLLQLKYYWEFFVEGFQKGFDDFFTSLQDTLGLFGIDVADIFAKVGDFLSSLVDIGQEDKWSKIGETAGKIAGIAASLFIVYKALSLFKPLLSLFKGGIPFFGKKSTESLGGSKPFDGVINVFSSLAKAKPTTVLKGMLNLGIIIGGLAILAAAIMAVSPYLAGLTDLQSFLEVVAAISILGVVGLALSKLSEITGKIPVATVALGLANMAIMIGGLSALLAIVGLVSMIPFDIGRVVQLVVVIGLIGVVGSALSAIAALIGMIPVPLVALGLANIAIIMGGLTALFAIMGLAASVASPGDVVAVITVVTILGVLGSALTLLAALIGLIPFPVVLAGIANIATVLGALTGLAALISTALPSIGENINSFITALEPAFAAFQSLQGLDMAGIGSFFTSFGAFMLQMTGDKILGFFTGGGTDLTTVAQKLVDFATAVKPAFEAFSQMPVGSVDKLVSSLNNVASLSGIDLSGLTSVGEQFGAFVASIKTSFADLPNIDTGIVEAITSCTTESTTLLTSFAEQGSGIGSSLMLSIASGITAQAGAVSSALSAALSGISVTASPSVTLNLRPTVNTSGMIGLATGGYVKETGVAVLHPDEVVVNDETTKKLNEFLNHNNTGSSGNPSYNSNSGETKNDYSVTFSAGSVVIQLSNSSDSELEKAADKLMRIIERKQQLKAMATRA